MAGWNLGGIAAGLATGAAGAGQAFYLDKRGNKQAAENHGRTHQGLGRIETQNDRILAGIEELHMYHGYRPPARNRGIPPVLLERPLPPPGANNPPRGNPPMRADFDPRRNPNQIPNLRFGADRPPPPAPLQSNNRPPHQGPPRPRGNDQVPPNHGVLVQRPSGQPLFPGPHWPSSSW